MKRDPNLFREICFRIENLPVGEVLNQQSLIIDSYDFDVISEHVRLLQEKGFIDAKIIKNAGYKIPGYIIFRLKNEGHDFLASVRDETVWNKVRQVITDKGGNLPVPIIAGLAQKILAQQLGL